MLSEVFIISWLPVRVGVCVGSVLVLVAEGEIVVAVEPASGLEVCARRLSRRIADTGVVESIIAAASAAALLVVKAFGWEDGCNDGGGVGVGSPRSSALHGELTDESGGEAISVGVSADMSMVGSELGLSSSVQR